MGMRWLINNDTGTTIEKILQAIGTSEAKAVGSPIAVPQTVKNNEDCFLNDRKRI